MCHLHDGGVYEVKESIRAVRGKFETSDSVQVHKDKKGWIWWEMCERKGMFTYSVILLWVVQPNVANQLLAL